MNHLMGKPTICKGEDKGADQPRSNCKADQCLCFRYTDGTIPLLSKCKISSLYPSSVTVQPGLCQTWLEPKLLVLSHTCSYKQIHTKTLLSLAACLMASLKKTSSNLCEVPMLYTFLQVCRASDSCSSVVST